MISLPASLKNTFLSTQPGRIRIVLHLEDRYSSSLWQVFGLPETPQHPLLNWCHLNHAENAYVCDRPDGLLVVYYWRIERFPLRSLLSIYLRYIYSQTWMICLSLKYNKKGKRRKENKRKNMRRTRYARYTHPKIYSIKRFKWWQED